MASDTQMRIGSSRGGGCPVRDAAGDAVDRLCFLSDALMAKPSSDLEAACRRGLGGMLEDVAVMLADALAQDRFGMHCSAWAKSMASDSLARMQGDLCRQGGSGGSEKGGEEAE